jgi:sterol desaturase/sphingolipid hydroxylase (fatty acid hydroxylase superfamily)
MPPPEHPHRRRRRWFVTHEPQAFGHGWISGTVGAVLGLAALALAVARALPAAFATPELRLHLQAPPVAPALLAAIVLAIGFAAASSWLRRNQTLAIVALGSASLALAVHLTTPPAARAAGDGGAPSLGLDVFALSLLVYTALFVPLERLWPRRPEQPTFRDEWWTDFAWFVLSALAVQLTAFVVLTPAVVLDAALGDPGPRLGGLPFAAQFVLVIAVADLVQYLIHRACHRVPLLWRFHRIHHSAVAMDWLAGSRLHLVDALLTRALVYLPLALLGADRDVIAAYLVFVAAQATFVHANVRWDPRWLEPWLVTPRLHHWHHAEAPPDVNFAVHLPLFDRLFGTAWAPGGAWPERYGLAAGERGPRGFWRQLVAPFLPTNGSR